MKVYSITSPDVLRQAAEDIKWDRDYRKAMAFADDWYRSGKDEKVYLILEFVNNAEDFVGANGTIFKGMKFYLTGSIDPKNYTNAQPEVFHQDYKTQVTFNVNSLENAWNIVPDLRSAQLEVGVQLQVEWIQATSFTGIMY